MTKSKPFNTNKLGSSSSRSERKRKSAKSVDIETVVIPPPPSKKTKLEASVAVLAEIGNDNQSSPVLAEAVQKYSSSDAKTTSAKKRIVSANSCRRSLRSSRLSAADSEDSTLVPETANSANSVNNESLDCSTEVSSKVTITSIPLNNLKDTNAKSEPESQENVVSTPLNREVNCQRAKELGKGSKNEDKRRSCSPDPKKLKEDQMEHEAMKPRGSPSKQEEAKDLLRDIPRVLSSLGDFMTDCDETGKEEVSPSEEKRNDGKETEEIHKVVETTREFQRGDLVWAALTGFPLWPAIVTIDPLLNTFYKPGKNGQGSLHVRFFGDGKRSWTLAQKALTFEGVERFLEKIPLATKMPKKNKNSNEMYISPALLTSWKSSAAQAEEFLSYTREEAEACFMKTIVKPEKPKQSKESTDRVRKSVKPASSAKTSMTPKARNGNSHTSTDSETDDKNAITKLRPTLLPFKEMLTSIEEEFGKMKNVKVCHVCEHTSAPSKSSRLLRCKGLCRGFFHLACLGISLVEDKDVQNFKCPHCSQIEVPHCQDCRKKIDGEVVTCSMSGCGKQFHRECLMLSFPHVYLQGSLLICPSHLCPTCTDVQELTPHKVSLLILQKPVDNMLHCIQCPTAYHSGPHCLTAGTLRLSPFQILCVRHRPVVKNLSCNVNWCFSCSKGGSLVCCENCPAAFHAECLGLGTLPEEKFLCPTCKVGKRIVYGDIVWAKVGYYRWWPARVLYMEMVPENVIEKEHQVGDFCVQFFGSYDFAWVNSNRVFLFQDGDGHVKGISGKSKLAICFGQAVREANEAYASKQAGEGNSDLDLLVHWKKPPPYVKIKANRAVGKVKVADPNLEQTASCECLPNDPLPCGVDSNCLNRIMMIECHPETCPAKENCQNQRFQKRQYPPLTVFKTTGRGWGLKADRDIKEGEFVIEYVGEIIDEVEFQVRLKQKIETKDEAFYFLTLDANRLIDAGPKGNLARFINHSCQPNCETQKWTVNGDTHVGIFAVTDIPAGTELTFNYQLECAGDRIEKAPCLCGAPTCSGFIGVKPKSQTAMKDSEKDAKKKILKKKRKSKKGVSSAKKHSEDDCFRCGEGGDLIMCDTGLCPKVYHLECLKLPAPPRGIWSCPWHHCDDCGKRAVVFCTLCPNSLCKIHADVDGKPRMAELPGGDLVCEEHDPEEIEKASQKT